MRLLTPGTGAVAGLAVGVAAALGVAVALGPGGGRSPAPPPPATPAAALAFLDDWERSRTSTYVVHSTFERVVEGRSGLRSESSVVQRPPDRMVTGAGSVSGRLDGRRIACATDEEGELRCRWGAALGTYRDAVDRELDLLEGYVLGEARLYDVARLASGCYELRLLRPITAPPYGVRAELCFDRATGAPVRSVVEREGATDITEAEEVRAVVSDGDLVPPAEPE